VTGHPEAASGGEIASAIGDLSTWHVMIHSGDETTSYVIRAADELTAAGAAGAQHGGPVDGCDVDPWSEP
jgi:hypothetical protein